MLRGGEQETVSSLLCVFMHAGSGFKVLTAGLLRVELAPEEYQLYSEGCDWDEEEDRTQDQHETTHRANSTTASCCRATMQQRVSTN